jgi:murein DD-endopeptidase MepM/ murein hydrolase activator NlpD
MHKPLLKIINRGNDPTGFGHFGASRGSRTHKGHDIVCVKGESVVSMIKGKVTKIGYAYSEALQFRYVQVENKNYKVWLMYLEPSEGIKVGKEVCEGDRVGYCLDVAEYHHKKSPRRDGLKMIPHLHIQMWENGILIDPNIYLKNIK